MITHVVAKTLVFDEDGKLLLLKRSASDEHRPGGLDLPGGKVEDDEDIVAAAAREALEEAGLEIAPVDMHWVYADTYASHNNSAGQDTNLIRVTFAVRTNKPEVTLSHEHEAFSWHPLEEALRLVEGMRYHEVLTHLIENEIAAELWKRS